MPPLTNLDARGPHQPVAGTPSRVPGSIRRTSSIDSTRHRPPGDVEGDPWGQMTMDARGRDLRTGPDGTASVMRTASVTAEVSGVFRELEALRAKPERAELQQLVGTPVGPGFRAKVDALVPDERDAHSLLYLLLDDLPGAGLVSGYSMLQADAVPKAEPGTERHDEYLIARSDLCAGWAADGSMMTMIREHGKNPTPLGPEAPAIWASDNVGWHDIEPLAPTAMRRIRRIDVLPTEDGQVHPVDVFFRDSYANAEGVETVVHEYSVSACIDATERTVASINATANVLPWQECPGAIASAGRLVGHALADLRPWVRETFTGTTTCTHLNDVLRGLSDVGVLLDSL
ncbi:MAG: DUF2889 domain-containing protein [Actinobacteria bacterium]|nr:DUF2889 domain-containing protein [Actinomycetota bacterium]